jgi:NADP-dependent 3-hydroxy acid dehydrogenase YdfG
LGLPWRGGWQKKAGRWHYSPAAPTGWLPCVKRSTPAQAIYYEHDVTHCKDVPALLQKVLADLGGLDLFIYNSGITPPINLEHYHYEQDRQTTEVNYIGALAWLNPVATLFQSLQAGQIVGISSVAGDRGRVGNPAYNATWKPCATALPAQACMC